jgi:hypothetical protein
MTAPRERRTAEDSRPYLENPNAEQKYIRDKKPIPLPSDSRNIAFGLDLLSKLFEPVDGMRIELLPTGAEPTQSLGIAAVDEPVFQAIPGAE